MNQIQHSTNQYSNGTNQLQPFGAPHENYSPERSDVSLRDIVAAILRRKWVIIVTTLLCLALGVLASMLMRKAWRAEAQLVLIQHVPAGQDQNLMTVETVDTQLAMMQSGAMADRTIQWLKEDALAKGEPTAAIDNWFTETSKDQYTGFQKMVKITNPKDTNVLNVSVEAHDRGQAALIANAVAQSFVIWKRDLAQRDITNMVQSLAYRVPRAQQQLLIAEQKEVTFQRANHILDVPSEQANIVLELHNHNADVTQQMEDIRSADSRLQALKSQVSAINTSIAHGSGARDDALVLSLQTQLNQLQISRANQATIVTKYYPGTLPQLDAQITAVQARLNAALQGTLNGSRPSLASQSALLDEYEQAKILSAAAHDRLATTLQLQNELKNQAAALPDIDLEYSRLARETQLAQTTYVTLQAELQQANLNKDKVASNMQISEPAIVLPLPFKPNWSLNLIVATFLGLLLSAIIVLLMDELNHSVQNVDDLRVLIPAPIVGLLPQFKRRQMQAIQQGHVVPALTEAMSFARIHLAQVTQKSAGMDRWSQQTILVTSAVQGEGKSVTAFQLAATMAQTGKSVILIDANLRHTAKEKNSPADQSPGFAGLLDGQVSLADALVSSDIPGLSILPSGATEQIPSILLAHPRLAAVMEAVRLNAEVIIIDTPDCSNYADALLLAPYASCIIQVVRMGWGNKNALVSAALALKATGKPLSVTVNSITRAQQNAYKNSYSYAIWNSQSGPGQPPKAVEKTLVLERSHDLVFSQPLSKIEAARSEFQDGTPVN